MELGALVEETERQSARTERTQGLTPANRDWRPALLIAWILDKSTDLSNPPFHCLSSGGNNATRLLWGLRERCV